uniref:Uncharacterized protein n=1 Tax=Streptomyces sp. NBC_00003 TaxID=2903608 RepID=A0AAU2VAN5_9ACTN
MSEEAPTELANTPQTALEAEVENTSPEPVQPLPKAITERLAKAEIRAHASASGVDVPDVLLNAIRSDAFVNETGEVNSDAVALFVSDLPKAKPTFMPMRDQGVRGSFTAAISAEQLRERSRKPMSHAEAKKITEAYATGRISGL